MFIMAYASCHYRVEFDNNPRGIFFDGQVVSGLLTIFNHQQKLVNRITLVVIGRGRIKDEYEASHKDYYFLRHEIVLADFRKSHSLDPAEYKYNFSFQLKQKTCPSFYGKKGFVHYEMLISLVGQQGYIGKYDQFKHPLIVIRSKISTKSVQPLFRKVQQETKRIDVCYWCCTMTRPYDISVQFPSRTFSPGDWVFIRVKCTTSLDEKLSVIRMKLVKYVKYTHMNGIEHLNEKPTTVAKVRTDIKEELKGKDFVLGLQIPLVHPTNEYSFPDLVTITYKMEILTDLLTCCDCPVNFDFDVPIHVESLDNLTSEFCSTERKQTIPITTQPKSEQNRTITTPVPILVNKTYTPHPTPNLGFQAPYPGSGRRSPNIGFSETVLSPLMNTDTFDEYLSPAASSQVNFFSKNSPLEFRSPPYPVDAAPQRYSPVPFFDPPAPTGQKFELTNLPKRYSPLPFETIVESEKYSPAIPLRHSPEPSAPPQLPENVNDQRSSLPRTEDQTRLGDYQMDINPVVNQFKGEEGNLEIAHERSQENKRIPGIRKKNFKN